MHFKICVNKGDIVKHLINKLENIEDKKKTPRTFFILNRIKS